MAETAQENIVSLEDYEHRRGLGRGAGAQAMREVCRIATDVLQRHIVHMMDKVDDALFDRAEKAESNAVQTRYFDAMREMRIIRKDIEEEFVSLLGTRFNNGVPRETEMAGSISLSWEDDGNGLGLVDKDDLEESLAIANLVHKIRGNCTALLFPLDKRIGFLIGDPDLERWQNPLGPESVCEAFKTAVRHVQTGTDIRLIIFKLFDQYVAGHLEDLYAQINQHLVNLGVLPQIRVSLPKTSDNGQETSDRHEAESAITAKSKFPQSEYSRPDLSSLPSAPGILPGHYDFRHSNPAINVLTLLQHSEHAATRDKASVSDCADPSAGLVNILHDIGKSSLIRNLGETGDMTLSVVAMIFDYILGDKNIPNAMRALIGRLQIPVLKVALLDQRFLTRKSHPARRLLNRLAVTAVGWDENHGEQDPVYRKIQSVVRSVLEQFEENIDLFEDLLSDFDAFLEKEETEARARAARSAKVMEGQERLDVAKSTTLKEIEPRVGDHENLDFVRAFVNTHWKNLLFICCARNGKDSDAWKQAVATMDDLIWSIKPKHTPEDRQRLVTLQPRLLKNLRNGMERLAVPPTERDDFIAKLVRAHGRTAAPAPVTETSADAGSGNAVKTETQVAAAEPTTSDTVATASLPRLSEEHWLRQVQAFKPGTWLEISSSDGKTMRAKLSWISPITGTFLFTDRQGLKAGNYTTEELVEMLHGNLARVIDTAPLMDRAVRTVLGENIKS